MMEVKYQMLSDQGGRGHNEDSVGAKVLADRACFVLCDGLGGHAKGEVASALVRDVLLREFGAESYDAETFLDSSMEKAQRELLEEQQRLGMMDEMKTTAVCLQIDGDRFRYAHCGDSRLYLFQGGKVKQRTLDHSVPQMLVATRQIREKDIRHHEDRNRLLRVMGTKYDKKICDVSSWMKLSEKHSFLLCSDGFWELIIEKEMEKSYKQTKEMNAWLEAMAAIVAERGKGKDSDNYSAIVAGFSGRK